MHIFVRVLLLLNIAFISLIQFNCSYTKIYVPESRKNDKLEEPQSVLRNPNFINLNTDGQLQYENCSIYPLKIAPISSEPYYILKLDYNSKRKQLRIYPKDKIT